MIPDTTVFVGRGMYCGSREDILTLASALGDILSESVRAQM